MEVLLFGFEPILAAPWTSAHAGLSGTHVAAVSVASITQFAAPIIQFAVIAREKPSGCVADMLTYGACTLPGQTPLPRINHKLISVGENTSFLATMKFSS